MATKSKRSSAILHKGTSRNSVISVKKEHSTASARALLKVESFKDLFRKYCVLFNSWTVPEVAVLPHEPVPGRFSDTNVHNSSKNEKVAPATVLIIFDNYEIQTVLNIVIFKQFVVDRGMLIALRKTFQIFDTLGTLKLEFCSLSNTDLRTLKTILQKNEVIFDLSINGNPNGFQNFYILLKGTKLLHLSMRFCQINDRGAHLISQQLNMPFEQPLTAINLSSNFVTDEGAAFIADALRINRRLLSLNLADNWMTDEGCSKLTSTLRQFPLRHDEIVVRRHRIMERLVKVAKLMGTQKDRASRNLESKVPSKDSVVKNKRDTSAKKSSKGRSSSSSAHKKETNEANNRKSTDTSLQTITESAEAEIGVDDHPFVKDSFPEDKQIYCRGNFKLINLNLAYNKLTIGGLDEIIETMRYQKTAVDSMSEGLTHVTLEGNKIPQCCNEIDVMYDLLRESCSKRLSSASHENRRPSKRKRSGLSKVSIIA